MLFCRFPQQQRLLHWWRPGSPYAGCDMMIADGSIRSGKTIACICSFLQFAQSNYSGQNFIVAGKTIGALKKTSSAQCYRSCVPGIGRMCTTGGQDNSIEIGDNVYYLYEANNEASQDKLQGLTAAGAYLDEAALMPESFVVQAIGRCSVAGAKCGSIATRPVLIIISMRSTSKRRTAKYLPAALWTG